MRISHPADDEAADHGSHDKTDPAPHSAAYSAPYSASDAPHDGSNDASDVRTDETEHRIARSQLRKRRVLLGARRLQRVLSMRQRRVAQEQVLARPAVEQGGDVVRLAGERQLRTRFRYVQFNEQFQREM